MNRLGSTTRCNNSRYVWVLSLVDTIFLLADYDIASSPTRFNDCSSAVLDLFSLWCNQTMLIGNGVRSVLMVLFHQFKLNMTLKNDKHWQFLSYFLVAEFFCHVFSDGFWGFWCRTCSKFGTNELSLRVRETKIIFLFSACPRLSVRDLTHFIWMPLNPQGTR